VSFFYDSKALSLKVPSAAPTLNMVKQSGTVDSYMQKLSAWAKSADNPASSLRVAPNNPIAYSNAFEMQLDTIDLGRSRSVHFNRANAALDQALSTDSQFLEMMEDLIPEVRQSVSSVGGRQNPLDWTWEHVHSTQAQGRIGVMRLVPTLQHTPGSPWWRILHPQSGAAGGYSEWAIPRGAPKNGGG
jgi:hypothetical protein